VAGALLTWQVFAVGAGGTPPSTGAGGVGVGGVPLNDSGRNARLEEAALGGGVTVARILSPQLAGNWSRGGKSERQSEKGRCERQVEARRV
jgi:hypothetical protein